MTQNRRASDLPLHFAVMWFTLAPLVNGWHGFSLVRIVVISGVFRIFDVFENLPPLEIQEVLLWALLLLGALANTAKEFTGGVRAIFGRRSTGEQQVPRESERL